MNVPDLELVRDYSERAYRRFHHPRYISPDPLELVVPVEDPREREVVGFIAASLAVGRVNAIIGAVSRILEQLSAAAGSVRAGVLELDFRELSELFAGFSYRFFSTPAIASFLAAIGDILRRYGSLEACFSAGLDGRDATVLPALAAFSLELVKSAPVPCGILVTDPVRGASKRMHLFLRWMVRSDDVDPGGWTCVSPEKLMVPIDTHMLRMSRLLGLTSRRTADIGTVREVTEIFRAIRPDDPVRYDFSLTRYGIHPEGREELLRMQ
ncbi:MAG TPA: TIGR02757 family protein [Spirochaetia bacterium]|nr:TIGR02757 family protein [Spirochaetia bacterium]